MIFHIEGHSDINWNSCKRRTKLSYPYIHYTRFGYFDFRQKFLKHSRLGAIRFYLKLCRIQIWVSKIAFPTGLKINIKKKEKKY